MAEKLTPQQQQAVSDRGGKLLVSAAAGSGKTKVLVDRLMSYLTDPVDPANIDEFLMITYTKAAASELRGKIAAKLSEKIAEYPENRHLQQQLQRLYMTNISTVHSFCGDILRQFAYRLELSADFRVADENECRLLQEAALEQVMNEGYAHAETDPDFCAFIDSQGVGRDDRKAPEVLLQVYHSAQCHLTPEKWLDRCIEAADPQGITDASQTLWGKYLMEDFFSYLDLQITAMTQCAEQADHAEGMENIALRLWDTVHQLQQLRNVTSWDEIVHGRNIDYGVLRFGKKVTDLALVEGIKAVRNGCKKGLEKYFRGFTDQSDSIISDLQSSSQAVRGMIQLVRNFKKVYDGLKRKRRILDFSDLEHLTLDLLKGKSRTGVTAVAKEIGNRFREVMVDEYQDSNEVQDAIYSALTHYNQSCFMVGDVKQSIYQFRLADPGIFLEKYASYVPASEAEQGQGRKVMLSRNFRSSGAVLSAVNSVFELCMSPEVGGLHYGEEEALYEGIPHEPLGEPEIEFYGVDVQEDTYAEEAAYTAQRIQELLDGKHFVRDGNGTKAITPEDIVILLRSPGSVGDDYRRALEQKGIKCAFGGGGDLLKAPEIMVLRSLLQTVYNPQVDIPMLAVLISPLFCFTADDLAQLRSVHRSRTLYQTLVQSEGEKCTSFIEKLEIFRRAAKMKTLTQLLETIFIHTRIDSIYGTMENGDLRRDNLWCFYQLAVDFENGVQGDLGRFLEYLDRMEEKGTILGKEPSNSGCVTIMSIHKSKGLEFPVVFLCSLGRSFNKESQRSQVLCDKELGLGMVAVDHGRRVRYPTISKRAISTKISRDSLSEELRVLYVAMTRAKDRLIMTYASNRLEKELAEMTARMNMGCCQLLTREVACPGEWVLMAALMRTEAGELFRYGGPVEGATPGEYPWLIRVVEGVVDIPTVALEEEKACLTEVVLQQIRTGLSTSYPYLAATHAPSKQTATQRKGRIKDQEASENAKEPEIIHRKWRKPTFVEQELNAISYGTAIHTVLEHIHCGEICDEVSIRKEIIRLQECGLLTKQQAEGIECQKLGAFFRTPLGTKVLRRENVLREFKFSILDDGEGYSEGLKNEQILLQGVVDCAIIEEDGIIIIDFKTDRVKEEKLDELVSHYRPQVQAYADALSRIYQMKIKQACLYFFELNQFVDVL